MDGPERARLLVGLAALDAAVRRMDDRVERLANELRRSLGGQNLTTPRGGAASNTSRSAHIGAIYGFFPSVGALSALVTAGFAGAPLVSSGAAGGVCNQGNARLSPDGGARSGILR